MWEKTQQGVAISPPVSTSSALAGSEMFSNFEEINLYVYHSTRAAFFDAVIWCLGPVVDDSRPYGFARCCLAIVTRSLCRRVIAATGQ